MSVWLILGAHRFKPEMRVNLDTSPCPTVSGTVLESYRYHIKSDEKGDVLPPIKKKGHVRKDEGGARRLEVDSGEPAPTGHDGGLGSVDYLQYHVSGRGEKGTGGKPPYHVPSMAEVAKIPWNGFTAISTFSGCGGSSLGYRMAGFQVLWASEFIEAARDSYRMNMRPGTILDGRDIREVTPESILEAIRLKKGELDLMDGSPPCASFSTAGKRQAGWGMVKKYSDTEQRTDDLFFEFVRILKGLQPKTFIAENVSGLVKGTAKGYFIEILKALKDSGYRVACRVLDAQWLGVPQQRQRTIFVGVREDLVDAKGSPILPAHPAPLPYRYSVREAIPWISKAEEDTGGSWGAGDITDSASPTVRAMGVGQLKIVEAEANMTGKATGAEFDRMVKGQQSERYFQLIRPDVTKPCPTVTAAGGNAGLASVCHPTERRKFSIAELRRICAFPDDFVLTGSYAQQWERLGRAVPPLMMRAIAETVRDQILKRIAGPGKARRTRM